MDRIIMRPLGTVPDVICWHCSRPIDRDLAVLAARYMYPGDQPYTAVIEDWMECECGAYQNSRRLSEISVEALGKGVPSKRER
jgi:hypothetical protein